MRWNYILKFFSINLSKFQLSISYKLKKWANLLFYKTNKSKNVFTIMEPNN